MASARPDESPVYVEGEGPNHGASMFMRSALHCAGRSPSNRVLQLRRLSLLAGSRKAARLVGEQRIGAHSPAM